MEYKVVISKKNNTFPIKGLNELLAGRFYDFRTKRYHNKVKADNDKVCCVAIRRDLANVKITKPIRCTYHIYAADKRHDRGNIYAAVEKSFLDALQQCKVIKNDGFDDVFDSTFRTMLDKARPRIEVYIDVIDDTEG
jgi:hypothetical protein